MTLKITELQNASGSITYALPRAMLRANTVDDNVIIHKAYNITSLAWVAQGVYTVNFASGTMPDANYVVQFWAGGNGAGRDATFVMHPTTSTSGVEQPPTSSAFNIGIFDNGGNDWDWANEIYVLCFR
jgi:hypothetical protein